MEVEIEKRISELEKKGFLDLEIDPSLDLFYEIEKLKKTLVTDSEFQKVKNQIETNFVNQNAGVAGIAESLANYKMYLGDANLINTELERYNKVTKEDLRRVANKYLTKENRVVLYYLPKAMEPKKEGKGE